MNRQTYKLGCLQHPGAGLWFDRVFGVACEVCLMPVEIIQPQVKFAQPDKEFCL